MYWSIRWVKRWLIWDVELFCDQIKHRLIAHWGPWWFLFAWRNWHFWIQLVLQKLGSFLHPCMLEIIGCGIWFKYFLLLYGNPNICVIHFIVQFLNHNICLRNYLCICEGGIWCISDLYFLLILDKQLGDGIGSIIYCYHSVGGILNFTGSDGSILIIYII